MEREWGGEKHGEAVRLAENRELLVKKIQGVIKLFEVVHAISENDWVYTNLESWEQQPESSVFYLISEDEIDELDDNNQTVENTSGEVIPKSLERENIETWLDIQTLQAISQVIQKSVKTPDSTLLIQAINQYREQDDFMEG